MLRVPGDAVEVSAVAVPEGNLATFRYNSGYGEQARLVIRTAAEWSQAWARITEGYFPRPPEPAVDFRQDMVVLVAMGGRPTGGYSITIEGVHEADGRLFAEVRERSPGTGCLVTGAFTEPIDVVRVPRPDVVTFVERVETVDCR